MAINVFSQLSARQLGRPYSFDAFIHYRLKSNIVARSYGIAEIAAIKRIDRIKVYDNRYALVAISDATDHVAKMRFYDTCTNSLKWEYIGGKGEWASDIYITDCGRVVCLSRLKKEETYDSFLHIFFLATGKRHRKYAEMGLGFDDIRSIAVLGNRIFVKVSEKNFIREYNSNNRILLKITSYSNSAILANSSNLFVWNKRYVDVFNDNQRQFHSFATNTHEEREITHVFMDKRYITCIMTQDYRPVKLYSYDFETAKMQKYDMTKGFQYTAWSTFLSVSVPEREWNITAAARSKQILYIATTGGHLYAIDLEEQKHKEIGSHITDIKHLSLDKQIMVSGSRRTLFYQAAIKVWDLVSHTELHSINIDSTDDISDLFYAEGRLHVAFSSALIVHDFSREVEKKKEVASPEVNEEMES